MKIVSDAYTFLELIYLIFFILDVFVTDRTTNLIVKMNKITAEDEQIVLSSAGNTPLTGLRMITLKSQPRMFGPNPCLRNPCQKMCFVIPSSEEEDKLMAQCECPRGQNSRLTSRGTNYCSSTARTDPRKCSSKRNGFCCANNRYLDQNALCDGVDNCLDGSDEGEKCTQSHVFDLFPCNDKLRYILPTKRCDGVPDCMDGSDEVRCKPCHKSEFQCKSDGKCIPNTWTCDGEYDCLDMSDEGAICKQCPGKDDFRCSHGSICIRRENFCNGVSDCPQQEDEADCFKF